MPRYMLLYTARAARPGEESQPPADVGPLDDDIDDVEEDLDDDAAAVASMHEWMAWSERVGDALVDFGVPLADGRTVTAAGSSASESTVSGYSIVEASDIEAAIDLVQGHPHLNQGAIEVFEAFPAPGL